MEFVDLIIFWLACLVAVFWTFMSFRYHFISSGHSSSRLVAIAMWAAIWFFKDNPSMHEAHLLWIFPAILISWFLLGLIYGLTAQAIMKIIVSINKPRVNKTMSNRANAAKLVIFNFLVKDYLKSFPDIDKARKYAAASTNHLFGDDVTKTHPDLNKHEIEDNCKYFINSNPEIRELLVQSLRVLWQVNSEKSMPDKKVDDFFGVNKILADYGKEFPNAPGYDSYNNLLTRELKKLPLAEQSEIKEHFHLS